MINIAYDGGYSLQIDGHAGQAPKGQDLVCAGASTLLFSLAEYLERNRDRCESLHISLKSGQGCVAAHPNAEFKKEAHAAFLTVIAGYKHLAHTFPEYIRFTDCR